MSGVAPRRNATKVSQLPEAPQRPDTTARLGRFKRWVLPTATLVAGLVIGAGLGLVGSGDEAAVPNAFRWPERRHGLTIVASTVGLTHEERC